MKFFVPLLLLLFSFSGFSEILENKDDGISTLKLGCSDPGRFHNQVPPTDIKITCYDERIEWEWTNDEDATFSNHRRICVKGTTDKPNIKTPKVCLPCGHPDTPYACGGYKEVCKTVELTYNVTCPQVMAMVSVAKFCLSMLDTEVAASSESILEVKSTGKTFNTCTQKVSMNGKVTEEKAPTKFINGSGRIK